MSTVEQITISGNTYDVYGTSAELKAYMAGRLNADAFDDATSKDRSKAHVEATRWMDREKWQGSRTDIVTPQPLAHPRVGLVNCDGEAQPTATLAEGICEATFELVLKVLENPSIASGTSTGSNIRRAKAGSAEVEFFQPGRDASGSRGTIFPTEAHKLIRCYLGGGGLGIIATGTDGESSFTECDEFGLSEGFK